MLSRTTDVVRLHLADTENFQLLCELQRDLGGFNSLVQNNRQFIRQGCLLKHSKRGLQQRMFFLVGLILAALTAHLDKVVFNIFYLLSLLQFSDLFIYGSKSPVTQAFKILGHVPVRSLLTENAEHNAFTIFGGQRAITVSSSTTAEKTLWLAELAQASADIKSRPHVQLPLGSLKNCSE